MEYYTCCTIGYKITLAGSLREKHRDCVRIDLFQGIERARERLKAMAPSPETPDSDMFKSRAWAFEIIDCRLIA